MIPGSGEYSITSELDVSESLFKAVDLFPGKELMLVNRPESFEVLVKVKNQEDGFLDLGTIENRELAAKVVQSRAKAKVLYVTSYSVKVELTYN